MMCRVFERWIEASLLKGIDANTIKGIAQILLSWENAYLEHL